VHLVAQLIEPKLTILSFSHQLLLLEISFLLHLQSSSSSCLCGMDHVAAVSDLTEKLFQTVPGHHGWEHISRVVAYTRRALETESELSEDNKAAVIVAALLHDADDPKVREVLTAFLHFFFFLLLLLSSSSDFCFSFVLFQIFPGSPDYHNAREILRSVSFPEPLQLLVLNSIKLVSCSTQNWANTHIPHERWMLIPRDADRLDAVGAQGVKRCLEYGGAARALYAADTPLPVNKDDILQFATQERFEKYKAGAKSASTLDHFYDKLLHLRCADSGNRFLTEQGELAMQEMIDILHPMLVESAREREAAKVAVA